MPEKTPGATAETTTNNESELRFSDKKPPLVTFALFAYNQEQFIREAVEGALNQTYSPLEIIFSDDCSQDKTFEVIKEMAAKYEGPHKIVLNCNGRNLGIGGHINKVVEVSSGDLIVLAAGDDISLPERTTILTDHWLTSGKSSKSIYSDAIEIDEKSISVGKLMKEFGSNYEKIVNDEEIVLGCAHAVDREVFEVFGPLDPSIVKEDQVIPFRSSLLGNVVRIQEELVKYRVCVSEWKKSPEGSSLSTKLSIPRYKGGVLRISAFEQMKKDLNCMDGCSVEGVPLDTIAKSIEDKLIQNKFFVSLIDDGFQFIIHYIAKERRFGFAELRALKRYVRLLAR